MVAFSQGTTQTFAGMGIIPEWYDENISMAVLLGPGTVPNMKYMVNFYTPETVKCFEDNDIYAIAGPNWEEKRPLLLE